MSFLSLPWATSAFGSWSASAATEQYWRTDAGVLLGTTRSRFFAHSHVRTNHSVNRRRPLAGSSTPWIPPSSYFREQFQFTYQREGRFKANSGYIDGPLGNVINTVYPISGDGSNPYYSGLLGNLRNSADILNAKSAAMTKALVDLGNSKAGLGENLAQAMKTADLFLDAGADIIRIALALKSGKVWNALKTTNPKSLKEAAKSGKIPKKLADQWLAYHYGWRPLAMDAYGLFQLLQEQLAPALLVHGRATHRAPDFQQFWTSPKYGDGMTPMLQYEERSQYSARCGLTGRLNSDDWSRTLNRVGLYNPISLVWELIPFSFVVDWVLPYGDVIKGLSATTGLSFVGGHLSERWDRDVKISVHDEYKYGGFGTPSTLIQRSGVGRTALAHWPLPTPYYRSPFLGLSRMATVAALLTKLVT